MPKASSPPASTRPATERLRVQVLGPLGVFGSDDRDLTPSGTLPRRLLSLLVLRRGRVVPVDLAVDALWPVGQPADPVSALQNHVSRLRRVLGDGVVETVAGGYRLDADALVVDVDRLVTLVGSDVGDGDAMAELDAFLERWRGPAYPELDDVDAARVEVQRLEELRIRARERRAEARLVAGRTDGLVAELTGLAEREPLRERPRALLMEALAATGRRVEALRVFDDFRRLLGDELGIEPSPVLVASHRELLGVDASGEGFLETRLPVPLTSLVGRERLVSELEESAEAVRLVTFVGPGGVGKTRLLVEVGHRLRVSHPHRPVVLCELAGADETSAVDAVAAALAIDARPGTRLVERIADVVGGAELVLLVDNCEHVLNPVAELTEHLLSVCAGVRVVATSRERLRVPGENLRPIPPLAVGASTAPAVRLFVEQAAAVIDGFEPDEDELGRIEGVVRRLDGLPLAIELAAARMHTLDLDELAAGLDQPVELLSAGYRSSTRHGSLSAAVSWSYRLLDPDLRRTFADLSVFSGPFDAIDAAAVCGVDVPTASTSLAQLVERSLVMRSPAKRYALLETLRAFGAERLDAEGRSDEVAERHARHLVDWVERADVRLAVPGGNTVAEIDETLPELRRALAWLLDHGEVTLAGRMVIALLDYGFLRLRPDVLAWAEQVAAADPGDRSPHAAQVWAAAGYAAWMTGDLVETGRRARRAREISETVGGVTAPQVLALQGANDLFGGRLSESAAWYGRAAEAARVSKPGYHSFCHASEVLARAYAGDPETPVLVETLLRDAGDVVTPHAAYSCYCAGEAALASADPRAAALLDRALELAEATTASFVTGVAGASRASIEARVGDPVAAASTYRDLIRHWRRAGMWSTQWTMLRSIAELLERLGRPHDAAVLEGAVRATTAGHSIFGADAASLLELGERLREELGDDVYEAARRQGGELDGEGAVEHALRAL